MSTSSDRNLMIDALKAFLAMCVLYVHTIGHFPEEAVPIHTFIVKMIFDFVVPTFYFIAGLYTVAAVSRIENSKGIPPYVHKRFRQLIVPSLVFTFFPFFEQGLERLSHLNTAHYFLPALFFITCLFCILMYLIRRCRREIQALILLSYGLSTTILMALIHDLPVDGYFNWRQVLHGNLFFILGAIAAIYADYSKKIFNSTKVVIGFGILYAIANTIFLYFPSYLPAVILQMVHRVILPLTGIFFVYGLFNLIFNNITPPRWVRNASTYLGQRSLALYILQELAYPILFAFIVTTDLAWPELTGLLSVVLCTVMALFFHDFICLNPRLERLIFGRSKPLKQLKDFIRPKESTLSSNPLQA